GRPVPDSAVARRGYHGEEGHGTGTSNPGGYPDPGAGTVDRRAVLEVALSRQEEGEHGKNSISETEDDSMGDPLGPLRPSGRRAVREGIWADRGAFAAPDAALDHSGSGRDVGSHPWYERRDGPYSRCARRDHGRPAQLEEAGREQPVGRTDGDPARSDGSKGRDWRRRIRGHGRGGAEPGASHRHARAGI